MAPQAGTQPSHGVTSATSANRLPASGGHVATASSYGSALRQAALFGDKTVNPLYYKLWSRPESEFRAGQLSEHVWFWEEVLLPASTLPKGQKDAILRWLTSGVTVADFLQYYNGEFGGREYDDSSPPMFQARNHPVETAEERSFVEAEVAKWLAYDAVECVDGPPQCCLPVGVAYNGKKLRLIWDGRYLNCWTPSPSMSYETLRMFQRGIEQGAWMFSLDHKAGYQHVPLAPEAQRYFGFRWGGKYYCFKVLPFGWAPACYIYDMLSGVVASFIRQLDLHCIRYLDDFGFALPAKALPHERHHAIWKVWAIFYFAGYTLARDKSMTAASQVMTLLGFGLDSVRQCYFVPQKKLDDILALVQDVTSKARTGVSVLALQSLVGKVQSLALAVPPVSIFLRSSHAELSRAARSCCSTVRLSEETTLDLLALRDLQRWQRLSLWPAEQHIRMDLGKVVRLETDASRLAGGW